MWDNPFADNGRKPGGRWGRDGTMESIRDILLKPKKKETPILDEIRSTVSMIHAMQQWFNTESDADLIESYVFEINALQARYNYLLRRVKELEGAT